MKYSHTWALARELALYRVFLRSTCSETLLADHRPSPLVPYGGTLSRDSHSPGTFLSVNRRRRPSGPLTASGVKAWQPFHRGNRSGRISGCCRPARLAASPSLSLLDCLKLWTHSRTEGSLEILITLELTELSVTHIRVHWPNYAGSSVIAVNRKVKERQMTISPPRLINSKQAGRTRRGGGGEKLLVDERQ